MHNVWVTLLGTLVLLWVIAAVRVFNGMANLPRLLRIDPCPTPIAPASRFLWLPGTKPVLCRSASPLYSHWTPRYEVIVVNDRSRDASPQILEQFARHNKNLKIVHVNELPKGWLGKSYAMFTAYEHATGNWLVFTDADVRFAPDLLRRALGLARSKQWDHLSVLFFLDLVGFWEKTAIGWWFLSNIMWLEPWRVSNPKSHRYSGSGAFQLLRRTAYEKIGTHKRLAMEVVEDIKLGKLVKQGGFASGVGLSACAARRLARCYFWTHQEYVCRLQLQSERRRPQSELLRIIDCRAVRTAVWGGHRHAPCLIVNG